MKKDTMGRQDDEILERNERSILTSFVIVEKCIKQRFYTPDFDDNGNKISYSSWSSFNPYLSYSISYTGEAQIKLLEGYSEEELITYKLIYYSGFEFKLKKNKLPLQNGYTDTS